MGSIGWQWRLHRGISRFINGLKRVVLSEFPRIYNRHRVVVYHVHHHSFSFLYLLSNFVVFRLTHSLVCFTKQLETRQNTLSFPLWPTSKYLCVGNLLRPTRFSNLNTDRILLTSFLQLCKTKFGNLLLFCFYLRGISNGNFYSVLKRRT